MTTPINPKRLLEDTLADDEAFRARSLETTLHAVRQRGLIRRRRRLSLTAAGVLLLGATTIFYATHPGPEIASAPSPSPAGTLSSGLSLVTTPVSPVIVFTTRPDSVEIVTSEPSNVSRVTTGDAAPVVMSVDDDGLFTLLAGRPAAIVRPRGGPAELLLLDANVNGNAEDVDGLMAQ